MAFQRHGASNNVDRVRAAMATGAWHTLEELSAVLGIPAAGVSARVRDLRKPKHGSHLVERRSSERGVEYRMGAAGTSAPEVGVRRQHFDAAATWETATGAPRTWRGRVSQSTTGKAVATALAAARQERPSKITRSSGNVFVDLGFSEAEAESLRVRSELMGALAALIKERKLTQSEAASLLGVHQPRVSDLVRGRLHLFSIDTLVEMLARTGMKVLVGIEPAAWSQPETVWSSCVVLLQREDD